MTSTNSVNVSALYGYTRRRLLEGCGVSAKMFPCLELKAVSLTSSLSLACAGHSSAETGVHLVRLHILLRA